MMMQSIFIVLTFATYVLSQSPSDEVSKHAEKIFDKWLKQYNIEVKNDGDLQKYKENVIKQFKAHSEHNEKFRKGEELFTKGINQFSHMTIEERKALLLGFDKAEKNGDELEIVSKDAVKDLPEYFNWADKGVIHKAQNQGCRDCYVHGTIATIEAHACIYNNMCEKLSEQEALECSKLQCQGGWDYWVYPVIQNLGGATFANYTYQNGNIVNSCDSAKDRPRAPGTKVIGWKVLPNDVDTIRFYLVNKGPMATHINVPDQLQHYTGGVFTDTRNDTGGHIIVLVGYGVENRNGNSTPYWIMRNSWGPNWGEDGYFRVIRGVDWMSIESSQTSFPILESNVQK